ncbi:MAG: thioredoxin domain-containing protein, partial [Planctomycetaceae bacterium]
MLNNAPACPLQAAGVWHTWAIFCVCVLPLAAGCGTENGLAVGQTRADEPLKKVENKPDDSQQSRPTNRLSRETSPYLLLHAHNPVDWYPWGPEAFEKARREKKPIFLSIGYSSCYWCHVMERKTFSDDDIAKYMNEHFVNIKVDREERPDVDDIYMTALIVYFRLIGSAQGGGWPLSMFLTPTGKPFAGGTYFPPHEMQGRPGFDSAMRRVTELWTTQQKQIEANADLVTREVQRSMTPNPLQAPVKLDRELVKQVVGALKSSYDPEYGGIDFKTGSPNSPKFPVPAKLALLQYEIRRFADERAASILYHTLDQIGSGGIRDHLGGGFHRYSTDRFWHVPHFEKMLYDQAQLADVYTEAYLQTNKQLYRQAVEEIFRYVQQHMTAPTSNSKPGGGFYSALDAETNAIEGEYYVWSEDEIVEALGADDARIFGAVYGLREENPFEHGFVIHLPRSVDKAATPLKIEPMELERRLAPMRSKLLKIRDERKPPLKDDKIITSWNGLMIRAYANAGRTLGRKDYIQAAEQAAMFILTRMRDDKGHLLRTHRANSSRLNAYLDDYAFLVEGLLALHRATHSDKWLNAAQRLTDLQLELFWDKNGRGFYFTSHQHEALIARTKNAYDAVLPSGNSVSVRNLIRLASLTGDDRYRQRAQETLEQFAPVIKQSPRGMTNMALAA